MTADYLRSVREATPFRPFTLHTVNGRTFRVLHRDYVSVSPGGRTVVLYRSDDSASVLDMLLISELELDPPLPAEAVAAAAG